MYCKEIYNLTILLSPFMFAHRWRFFSIYLVYYAQYTHYSRTIDGQYTHNKRTILSSSVADNQESKKFYFYISKL